MQGWDIVLSPDAIASEKYAAEEFQQFFAQASGVKLPITTRIDRPDKHIFIGSSKALEQSNVGFHVDGFGEEDLRIIIRDDNVAIAGGRPRGTLYGVYTFLEDYCGVRFLTADRTHVPAIGKWRVVGPVDRFYHPPFSQYRLSGYFAALTEPVFAVRTRTNGAAYLMTQLEEAHGKSIGPELGGQSEYWLVSHSAYYQVPASQYAQSHPQYFAMRNGKREITPDSPPTYQLCCTNPDVQRIVTEAVLKAIEENPDRRNFSVGQGDSVDYCQCPRCAAVDEREASHMGAQLTLVNAVADEVAKRYPNVKIGTLAYRAGYTRNPPKHMKPAPNVQIQLSSMDCCILHALDDPNCPQNAAFLKELQTWGEISNDILIWTYGVNFWHFLLPTPNLPAIEQDVRLFAANNVKGVFYQCSWSGRAAAFADLRHYVTSRMLWDPSQDADQLINEFLRLHYGQAAPPIRQFLTYFHDRVQAKGIHRVYAGHAADYGIDQAVADAAVQAFEEAIARAEDDGVLKERVEKASIVAYRCAIDDAVSWLIEHDGELDPLAMPAELRARTAPQVEKFVELCEKYGTGWCEVREEMDRWLVMLRQVYAIDEGKGPEAGTANPGPISAQRYEGE
jgi:hypothetical protein